MVTYDIFKKEKIKNFQEISKLAEKFNLPDRKEKSIRKDVIVLEKFKEIKDNEIEYNNDKCSKEKINDNYEDKEELEVKILPKGLMFEKFSIENIRKNLDKIIFYDVAESRDKNNKGVNKNIDSNEVSKYNEIDVIVGSEIMDTLTFKNMNKNFISLAFNFSEIFNRKWVQRAKKISIMKKNFKLAKKYKVNCIVSTFAGNIFEYKSAETLMAFGKILGMSNEESRNSISKNFENIMRKFNARNDEKILTDGLEVLKFGSVKKKKKKYGYF